MSVHGEAPMERQGNTHELLRTADAVLNSSAKLIVEARQLIAEARRIRQESRSNRDVRDEA